VVSSQRLDLLFVGHGAMLARIRFCILLVTLSGLACQGLSAARALSLLPPTSSGCVEAAVKVPPAARLHLTWHPSDSGAAPGRSVLEVWLHRADKKGTLLQRIPFDTGGRERSVSVDLSSEEGEVCLLRVIANSPVTWKQADLIGRTTSGEPSAWRVKPRPNALNVIVYLIDTLRPDVLGAYGGPGPTPTLDRLAAQGILFERAYSTSSWTRPAVASLFSGLTMSAHQVSSEAFSLPEGALTLAERFRLRGYQTMGFVANGHVLPTFHFDQGFETYVWPPFPDWAGSTWDPDALTPNTAAAEVHALALRRLAEARNPERPLFLYIHTVDPHQPYQPPEWLLEKKRPGINANSFLMRSINEGEGASVQLLQDLALAYQGAVAYSDHELGRFLDQVADYIDLNRTVILVTSDHGEAFFEHRFVGHRNWLHEELIRVPMILVGPGVPAGQRNAFPVSLLDVVPTLLGLSERQSKPTGLAQGFNLASGDLSTRLAQRSVYSEFGSGAALVNGEWKLTYRGDYPEALRFRLYNLHNDPMESNDLFAREPAIERRLQLDLRNWQTSTHRLALEPLPVDAARLDPGLRQNLRALGYLR
jgi:arylsulfatase